MTQPLWLGADNGCFSRSVHRILTCPDNLLLINAPRMKQKVAPAGGNEGCHPRPMDLSVRQSMIGSVNSAGSLIRWSDVGSAP